LYAIGATIGFIGIAYGELSSADIAQITPQQRYTYDMIGQAIPFIHWYRKQFDTYR